jgi:hypothetical protein
MESIEEKVDAVMTQLDDHECCSSKVPHAVTIEFYEDLIQRLRERLDCVKQEAG